jgi:hypothetical protein
MSIVYKSMPRIFSAEFAGIVHRFLSLLRRHRMQWMLDLTSPPDTDVISAILDVEKRAGTDGSNNLPSASDTGITGSQKDIVDYHRRLKARARSRVEKLAVKLNATARRVEVSKTANRLRDIPSKCRNKLDRVLAEFESKGAIVRKREEPMQQTSNKREVESTEADSGRFAATATYIVLTLAVLAIATFALSSELIWGAGAGPLLYTDPAFGIAAIAVVVPFIFGVSIGNQAGVPLSHKRPASRIAILLTIGFLIILASFCAHLIMRATDTQAFAIKDAAAALNAMIADSGAIASDINALKGFGVVLIVGLLGFLLGNKAVGTDEEKDSVHMADLDAGKYSEAEAKRLRKRINKIIDASEREVDRSVKYLQKQFNKLSQLVEQARDTQVLYDNYLAGLEECCNMVLERYRDINTAERNTDMPPSFSERISFRLEGASRILFFEDGIKRHQKSDDEMKALHDAVAETRQNLRDLNRIAICTLDADALHREAEETYADSRLEPASG